MKGGESARNIPTTNIEVGYKFHSLHQLSLFTTKRFSLFIKISEKISHFQLTRSLVCVETCIVTPIFIKDLTAYFLQFSRA